MARNAKKMARKMARKWPENAQMQNLSKNKVWDIKMHLFLALNRLMRFVLSYLAIKWSKWAKMGQIGTEMGQKMPKCKTYPKSKCDTSNCIYMGQK